MSEIEKLKDRNERNRAEVWRSIVYPIFMLWFALTYFVGYFSYEQERLAQMPIWLSVMGWVCQLMVLFAIVDGFLYLRRSRRLQILWRVYWLAILLTIIAAFFVPKEGVEGEWLNIAFTMAFFRLAFKALWWVFSGTRKIVRCVDCGRESTRYKWHRPPRDFQSWLLCRMEEPHCLNCGSTKEPAPIGKSKPVFGYGKHKFGPD